ncbi:trimeric intracellular cation channel family protein [Kordiimonas pumila]|uniref:Trimeric intracellular cation channel family protein n=1 Tax=Kordiimonas pumila TaxID=2161677 RepID=A0ABV7D7E6_9PROT|nr:trimeric intracellular cation channel family protein [Kordiimonas pumila]
MHDLLFYFDMAGVFVFAISGALAAVRKGMDLFGIIVLALMPAVGGGTIRDLVLDQPVFWIVSTHSIWVALIAAGLTFLFARHLESRMRWLIWADAAGLALFCVVGAEKALVVSGSPMVAIMLGVTTGVAGGVIRDVICNEIPLVMRVDEYFYATAAFFGAGVYCLMDYLGYAGPIALWAAIATAFTTRAMAILKGWRLPKALR